MMIKVLVFATLSVSILPNVRSQQPNSAAQIVKFTSSPNSGNGEYSFEYELSDGTYRQESGTLQKGGTPDQYIVVQGVYRWISPEGARWETQYSVDDTGYHASNVFTGHRAAALPRPSFADSGLFFRGGGGGGGGGGFGRYFPPQPSFLAPDLNAALVGGG